MTGSHDIFQYEAPDAPPAAVQVLDPEGHVVDDELLPDLTDQEFVDLYHDMKLTRRTDQRAVSLQRQGRSGTLASCYGQGAHVATAHALDERDWLVPCYREYGTMLARGIDPRYMFMHWMGKEPGDHIPEEYNTVAPPTPVATQIPHATGLAMAAEILGADDRAFLCHFGDGATSEGDFHEGLNFAGAFDTPSIFVCNNNQYAISVPFERQTGSATVAQKATAYGFDGVYVDGMDPLAVYVATAEAVRRAKDPRDGESRQSLIELLLYRLGGHSTSDDPSKYRDEAEVEEWTERDPIARLEAFLQRTGRLDDETVADIESRVDETVDDAVEAAEAAAEEPAAMFDHVYHEPTPELERQAADVESLREQYGDDAFTVEWGF
ncbi:thiamine pyrophosphate-dependent dehydrogenase E1 component subunit alpha [Halorarius litoreus]|uniref:thiamine pyrophosphate-dependent dehydrogenase E1 component subunit alpha n=1 Tax=Halorarius litoreus TaxID=2962676 RepID=UPI0020CC9CCB|nr:thiamine pyrophosphate-dependent dehydrogenase E1 component subunit alpha [Halorarius litoreus]